MKDIYADVDFHGQTLKNFTLETLLSPPTTPYLGQVYMHSLTGDVMAYSITGEWVNLSKPNINGAWLSLVIKGEIDPSVTNTLPSNPTVNDTWLIVSQSGTVGGLSVSPGDQLLYTLSGWLVMKTPLEVGKWLVLSSSQLLGLYKSYLCDLTGGALTFTLPLLPQPGQWLRLMYYGSNTLTLDLNGSLLQGGSSSPTLLQSREYLFVYLNASKGWVYG